MDVFRFGLKYWKKFIPLSLLSKLFSLIAIVCDLTIPLISAGLLDYIIAYDPADPPAAGLLDFLFMGSLGAPGSWELFGNIALVFAGVLCTRLVFLYCKNISYQWCGLRMECLLREETYAKLLELDGETIARYNMGELLTTMNRDTIIFKEMYSRIFMNIFDSVVSIVLSIALLATLDTYLLIIPLVLTPFIIVALVSYLKKARRLFASIREGYSAINLDVQENVDAVRIVRSFAAEEEEIRKFDECNTRVRDLSCREVRLTAKFNSIFTAFQQVGYVGTVVIAVLLVLSGDIALGALTAATTYVTKIISHITQISRAFFMMQNQLVSGGRLKRFLTEESAVPDCPSALVCSAKPHIEFRDVSFTLGEKQVLKHISLDVPYGKKVGLMGGTGSGKSAMLKMLSRIFDATAGEVTIDGKDIRDYPLEQVRAAYSYVFQDVFLFSNTVDANVAFAHPDCTEDDVFRASDIAQASAFIKKLPDGYETIVGERGVGLSGGQKQRISIARALIKGSPVLILDDASSALDMATEKRVLAAIKEHCPENTLFIATHRVSSVMDCDEILFLRDGEIVERGTAQQLIEQDGAFAAIWKLQTSDGQLDDSSYGAGEE